MVSIEENSVGEFAEALASLTQSGMSPEALAGLRGVAPWARPTKPDMTYGNGLVSPAMGELAEAAWAYTDNESNAASPITPAHLTLVADNSEVAEDDAAGDDAESAAVKAEASQLLSEIQRMDSEVKAGLGAEIVLLKMALHSGRVPGVNFEAIRDRIATAGTNAQNGKAESPEQKRERLWNEIEALDKEAGDILRPHMSEEECKKDEEYQRRIANSSTEQERLAITQEYHGWRREITEDWKVNGTPAQRDAALRAEPVITRSEQTRNELAETIASREQTRSDLPNPGVAPEPVVLHNESLVVPDLKAAGVSRATEQATNTALPRVAVAASAEISMG